MTDTSSRIIRHSTIYMFGDVLRYSVSLIMLPIYTRYLTPEDYGVVELLSMLIDFAAILFGARVGQSVFRFYCTASSLKDKNTIVSSALFLGILFNGMGAIAVAAFSGPLAASIFHEHGYAHYIMLFSATLLLLPLTEIPMVHIRAQQKPWLFFTFSLLKLSIQVGLNIYFVVLNEMHVLGVIYSAVISALIMAVILTGYSVSKTGISLSIDTCKTLISFSLPLKLASVGSFYLAFGDRYVLNMFTDLSQVGIYSLGYKFGFILTLVAWTPFEKTWDAEKYAIHNRPDAKLIYQRTFLYSSTALITAGLFISLFAKDLLIIMSDPAFYGAHTVVPVIILAYIFQAWTKYCSLGILLEKKTMHIAYSEMIGAGVITIAYFTLIPAFGMHGAAWATVIGFIARFYWANHKGKEFYNMELPWMKIALTTALAAATFALSLQFTKHAETSILLHTAMFFTFIILFIALPILSKNEKQAIAARIRGLARTTSR